MGNSRVNQMEERRSTGLLPGLNGVETCVTLSEEYGELFWGTEARGAAEGQEHLEDAERDPAPLRHHCRRGDGLLYHPPSNYYKAPMTNAHQLKTCLSATCFTTKFQPAYRAAATRRSRSADNDTPAPPHTCKPAPILPAQRLLELANSLDVLVGRP
jgi:hypothetical protein